MSENIVEDSVKIVSGLVDEAIGKKRTKKIRSESDGESTAIKVSLPSEMVIRVRAATDELKNRGANVSAEDLLSDYLNQMPPDYFEKQISKKTPEDYYLEVAKQMPELRHKLILIAKRAFSSPKKSTEKTKKKAKIHENNQKLVGLEGVQA